MLGALRVAWLVLGVGTLSALGLAVTTDVDRWRHDQYSKQTRRARELDARLNEEVAKSRLGIVTHYDDLVRTDDQIRVVQDELDRIPDYVGEGHRSEIERRLERYAATLDEKRDLVETFKSEQAILRNSLRAFPRSSDRLLARIERTPDTHRLHEAVESLQHDVMRLALAPSRKLASQTRCDLRAFDDEPKGAEEGCSVERAEVPPSLSRPVDTVLTHARIIIERRKSTEDLVADIMTLPGSERAGAVADAYEAAYRDAEQSSRTRWGVFLALGAALLMLGAAYIIVRLQTSAAKLRETTGKLSDALDALAQERDREKELADLKSRFVSMTSHEFRTPLSVILSSSEMLEAYGQRWPEEKRAMHLHRVQDAAQKMSRMLDGVLLIGRAEAGMLHLNAEPTDVGAFCDGVVEELRAEIGADRELRAIRDLPDREVSLDQKLLRHVLLNLLSNAFKYSPDDSVVTLEVGHDDEAIRIEVSDEGIGIPEEERERLFEAFHRCSNASGIAGNGLGLAVVQRSLEVQGGSVEVDSTVGEGTTFRVRVPFVEDES